MGRARGRCANLSHPIRRTYDGAVPGEELLERISIDPAVAFGKPTVKGARMAVGHVLELLAGGMTTDDLLEEYPQLTGDDVRACLAYGAQLANATSVDGA